MVATVRVISVALYLLWWDDDPLTVFASTSKQGCADIFDLGGVAVSLIAAAFSRIVRHVPRAVELFVELHILRRVVVFLGLCPGHQTKGPNKSNAEKERAGGAMAHGNLEQSDVRLDKLKQKKKFLRQIRAKLIIPKVAAERAGYPHAAHAFIGNSRLNVGFANPDRVLLPAMGDTSLGHWRSRHSRASEDW
jgi:hypothetical protein